MEVDIQWATDMIEKQLQLEERNEKIKSHSWKHELASMGSMELEEKDKKPVNTGVANIKAEERVRRTSLDLRREIIGVGGIQNLIELRKKRKNRKIGAALAPEPKLEEDEPTGPVNVPSFLQAAVNGKMKTIEKFLEDGGSPDVCDEFKRSALHRASLGGHLDIVQTLLEHRASTDLRDRLDCTAVHWAARGGRLEVLKLLQSKGASVNVKDKLLSTPLHVAARTGRVDIVEHLLSCGIEINAKDREGDTALHDAVRLNRYRLVKLLIVHGADMQARNVEGKTPVDLVQQWQLDTKEVLEKTETTTGPTTETQE
ncbi:ankyrin repeat domain-containing protein 2 [Latimeria chalumnae]|uniref:Ankyrin repeat domain 2 n=1 Tax=Latimeria chalumnae TaxID=7897 RepID=H3ARH1_LATCH|nr:PREDICTED: ankyrin repeat domain-containing protein 2 [Latimeria chalumnae]|eukprot:XP_005994899.1 PREDICTED: ankyrin repeat domain-containing protein 2 [Latimeria chalumnae]